jgi:glycosyltransferase involved in cell wall biosynthesis
MRIVYFHQYFATRDSATGTRSFELAKRFAARGHAVTIVSSAALLPRDQGAGAVRLRPFVRDRIEGIDLVLLNVPYSNYFSYALRLAAFGLFTAGASIAGPLLPRPDVVFASSTPLTIGIPGLLTARLRRVPFVFELRDLWPEVPVAIGALRSRPLIAAARQLEALLYRGAARIVVLSEASRDALLERGVPAGKLVFVPNACDLDLFSPENVDHEFRAGHGLTGKFVALYSGAMGRANGIDQLIDAAVALRDAGRDDVAIVAVGDGGRRPHLEASARRLGLDNLHVLGPLPKQRLAGVVGAADVTLTLFAPDPIFETNSPNKFFDSLAAGRPVIVNLDGWLRRVLNDARAGVYVPAGDGDALAATLAALADEPALVMRMATNARLLAEREFARDVLADRLCAALEGAALEGAARRRPAAAPFAGTPPAEREESR